MMVNNFLSKGLVILVDYEFEPFPTDPIFAAPGTDVHISVSATRQTFTEQHTPIFDMPCRKNTTLHFVKGKSVPSLGEGGLDGWEQHIKVVHTFFDATPFPNSDKLRYNLSQGDPLHKLGPEVNYYSTVYSTYMYSMYVKN